MNTDKHSRPEDEAIIEQFSRQARDVDVPPHLRQSNAARIRGALEQMTSGHDQRMTWWRRRISVPLPVAAAVLLVVLVQLALQLTGAPGDHQPAPMRTDDAPMGPSATIERPQYAERCVYIAHLGVVESNRTYFH